MFSQAECGYAFDEINGPVDQRRSLKIYGGSQV